MKPIKQATWLPIFTGYYNSIFDDSDYTIERETELSESEYQEYYEQLFKAGVSYEFFQAELYGFCNFTKCFEAASQSISDALINLDHADIILDVIYEKTVSPKYYNFSTDSINCTIEYDADKLRQYIYKHSAAYSNYLIATYTSRSGFISSYSNDFNDWLNFDDLGEHELGSVLQFVINNESEDAVMDLYYECNLSEDFMDFELDTQGMIKAYKESITEKAV